MSKTRSSRAPPLPRGRWCAPDRRLSSGRHLPLPNDQSLRPRWNIPSEGVTFTRRHQGFTHVRPSPRRRLAAPARPGSITLPVDLLLARHPRMEQGRLRLLPRASHPAVTHRARRGGDGPSRTGPGTTPRPQPPSMAPPTSLMHPHVAPGRKWLPAPPAGPPRRAPSPPADTPGHWRSAPSPTVVGSRSSAPTPTGADADPSPRSAVPRMLRSQRSQALDCQVRRERELDRSRQSSSLRRSSSASRKGA
jgi:hypothetical protein